MIITKTIHPRVAKAIQAALRHKKKRLHATGAILCTGERFLYTQGFADYEGLGWYHEYEARTEVVVPSSTVDLADAVDRGDLKLIGTGLYGEAGGRQITHDGFEITNA